MVLASPIGAFRLKNRVAQEIEDAVVAVAIEQPAFRNDCCRNDRRLVMPGKGRPDSRACD
jgi:hypothetical protein